MALAIRILMMLVLASALWAQQAQPSNAPASSSKSQNGDVADQQPQTEQPPSSQPSDQPPEKSKSKVKQQLEDLAPQCIGITGGAGKCRHEKENPADTKKEDQERQLRQQCSDAANQAQAQCAALRKSDSIHDTKVGDDYLSDKHYVSAVNRYCLALKEDPTNVTATQHLAQALKKSGSKATTCEQLPQFQQQTANDTKDRETLKCAHPPCTQ